MSRRLAYAVVAIGMTVWVACRYDVIWTGAEFVDDGAALRLAAAEPLCGCVKLRNVSGRPVHLRSFMEGQELGWRDVPPGEMVEEQFDWGGPRQEQAFLIDAWTQAGEPLQASQVLSLEDSGWPWHGCGQQGPMNTDVAACADGPLKLKTGRARLW
ncbi:MAG: hypothetical protein AB7K63_15710 [Vicinamibacterales bacterium]